MSTSNPHNEWLKERKRLALFTALASEDLPLRPWAEKADVDVKTILKHRDEWIRENAITSHLRHGVTYYHLNHRAALNRGSASSWPEPEYLVRQTEVPETREIPFTGTVPKDGTTVREGQVVESSVVIGRPYWKVYGQDMLAEFRNKYGLPTLTQQEIREWQERIGLTAEFSVGPPPNNEIPKPGVKLKPSVSSDNQPS